jgi:hypothetical protein
MKKNLTFCAAMILFGCMQSLAQQSPLVGTWEMISGKITNPDGQQESFDTLTYRETKIITPTHYMFMAYNKSGGHNAKDNAWIFQRSMGGTVKITGNKFVETPTMASNANELQIITDLTWKVEGDRMIQKGWLVTSDGKKYMMDELIFRRVGATNKGMAKSK